MHIIWTQSFDKQYHAYRGKQVCGNEECIAQISKNIQQMLALKRPYYKLKFFLQGHAIRMLIKYYDDIGILIPLFITDKNDKRVGYNMTRITIKAKIIFLEEVIEKDIVNSAYQKYDM